MYVILVYKTYKKYGHKFQIRPFFALMLFYKYNRVMGLKKSLLYVIKNYFNIKVYKNKNMAIAINNMFNEVDINTKNINEDTNFFYFIDEFKFLKLDGKILGNVSINYNILIDNSLDELKLIENSDFNKNINITII